MGILPVNSKEPKIVMDVIADKMPSSLGSVPTREFSLNSIPATFPALVQVTPYHPQAVVEVNQPVLKFHNRFPPVWKNRAAKEYRSSNSA